MSIAIQLIGVEKHYGATSIFADASVAIRDDHRLGVVGRNGAGKSTLCRMILGEEEPDAGRIERNGELRFSYLEQRDPFVAGETALAFLMRASGCPDWRCGEIAGRFLLKGDALAQPVAGLSGGYQTRLKLAAMLLKEPDFLILDEPTNYLDLTTLLLLEQFLRDFRGGFLVVSHDREFLKRTCRQTLDVARARIELFDGDIEAWLARKAERRAHAERHNANVATRRKQLQDFVDRNRARASSAAQAQSKLKMIERLEELDVAGDEDEVRLRVPPVEERKGTVLRCEALAVGYPGRTVASGIDLDIDRGRRVAVLGDNGQGKTTFLATVAGKLAALGGTFRWGHAVRIGHYAQHVYAAIDARTTVRAHLERCADGAVPTQEILDLAGGFLFRGDDVEKKVEVLSGGERSRLCLAGLLLARHPVLILDEPTNHLDFATVEALAVALRDWNGTVFFTCHDRAFVSAVATDVIEVRDGSVRLYGDSYQGYVQRLTNDIAAAAPTAAPVAAPVVAPATGHVRRDKAAPARLRQVQLAAKTVERRLAGLDAERKRLEERLASGYDAAAARRLAEVIAGQDASEVEWLRLQEEAESLDA